MTFKKLNQCLENKYLNYVISEKTLLLKWKGRYLAEQMPITPLLGKNEVTIRTERVEVCLANRALGEWYPR